MEISINALLEANACTLWHVFLFNRLVHMVIRRPRSGRAELVELIMASTPLDTGWNLESQKMERFRPTKLSVSSGKTAQLN